MTPESQPKHSVNLRLAITLLVIAGLVFGSFVFFRSKADDKIAAVNLESSIKQSEAALEVTREDDAKGTVITTGDSEFGSMLFDSKAQAIYIWELESSDTAKCYGSCAKAWPPVLTDGAPIASTGVNGALLGTTQRTDGTTQVTYNGHPLYYYANEKAGEVKCHNIKTHGGLWWVIQPSGDRAS